MTRSVTALIQNLMNVAIHRDLRWKSPKSWLLSAGSVVVLALLSSPAVSATDPNPNLPKQPIDQLNFDNAHNYFLQANELYQAGNRSGAIAAYQQAIELEPNYVDAYVGLGNALDDNGQTTEAIAVYRAPGSRAYSADGDSTSKACRSPRRWIPPCLK